MSSAKIYIYLDKYLYSVLEISTWKQESYVLGKSEYKFQDMTSFTIQEFIEEWKEKSRLLNVIYEDNLDSIIPKRKLSGINATLKLLSILKNIKSLNTDKYGDFILPYTIFPDDKLISPLEEILKNWGLIKIHGDILFKTISYCNKYQNSEDDIKIKEYIKEESNFNLHDLLNEFCGYCDYYYDRWSYFRYKYMLEYWNLIQTKHKEYINALH